MKIASLFLFNIIFHFHVVLIDSHAVKSSQRTSKSVDQQFTWLCLYKVVILLIESQLLIDSERFPLPLCFSPPALLSFSNNLFSPLLPCQSYNTHEYFLALSIKFFKDSETRLPRPTNLSVSYHYTLAQHFTRVTHLIESYVFLPKLTFIGFFCMHDMFY